MTAILNPVPSVGPTSQESPLPLGKAFASRDSNTFADFCVQNLVDCHAEKAADPHAIASSPALPGSANSDSLDHHPDSKPVRSSKLPDALTSVQMLISQALNPTPVPPAPNGPLQAEGPSFSSDETPPPDGNSTSTKPITVDPQVQVPSSPKIPSGAPSISAPSLQLPDFGNLVVTEQQQSQAKFSVSNSEADTIAPATAPANSAPSEDSLEPANGTETASDSHLMSAPPTEFASLQPETLSPEKPSVTDVETPKISPLNAPEHFTQSEGPPLGNLTPLLSGTDCSVPNPSINTVSVVSHSLRNSVAVANPDSDASDASPSQRPPVNGHKQSFAPIVATNFSLANPKLTVLPGPAVATTLNATHFPISDSFSQHATVPSNSESSATLNNPIQVNSCPPADASARVPAEQPNMNTGRNDAASTNARNSTSPASTPSSAGIQDAQANNPGPSSQDPSARKNAASNLFTTNSASSAASPVSGTVTSPISQSVIAPSTGNPGPDPTPANKASETAADNFARLPTTPAPIKTGSVQMAQILNKEPQSEMRIDLNTSAFGKVEVRTLVQANDVGLQIGSEKGDLRSLLATELPAITGNLQRHDLRLNEINFHQQGLSFSSDSSRRDNPQPHFFAHNSANLSTAPTEASITAADAPTQPQDFSVTSFSVLA